MQDNDDFMTWFDSLPDDERDEVLARLRATARALGVTVKSRAEREQPSMDGADSDPEQVSADDQDAIDSTFRDIMKGFDL